VKLRPLLRGTLALVAVGSAVALVAEQLAGGAAEPPIPFDRWYGHWRAAAVAIGLFALFLFAFARPRRPREWRHAGLYCAFLISLFTEMFGVPLTIYVLSALLGLPVQGFGLQESHLWAYLLARLGLIPLPEAVRLVMVVSVGVIAVGICLVALGWRQVYAARYRLVTTGLYGWLRHPQYLGLILVVLGFLIMWPTLPTVLMAPILVGVYVGLARREEAELEERFMSAFRAYRARVPAFLPWPRPRAPLGHPGPEGSAPGACDRGDPWLSRGEDVHGAGGAGDRRGGGSAREEKPMATGPKRIPPLQRHGLSRGERDRCGDQGRPRGLPPSAGRWARRG
jgi:protein-S-isoprenylcysteine O-methyltransferase Ste14